MTKDQVAFDILHSPFHERSGYLLTVGQIFYAWRVPDYAFLDKEPLSGINRCLGSDYVFRLDSPSPLQVPKFVAGLKR
jgi:hypothetical protein